MRQVVLDTETTGIDPAQGHRIIEIGATELLNRRATGRVFHRYLQPDRLIEEAAIAVHGIRNEHLVDQPRFHEVAEELLEFVRDADLIMHNAVFDVGFLEHELTLMSHPQPAIALHCRIVDTLAIARQMHPGQRNSLDALCKRYSVDNSKRDLHGALLDAQLLADVYLAMTGGQASLVLETEASRRRAASGAAGHGRVERRGREFLVVRADGDERSAHEALLAKIDAECGGAAVWKRDLAHEPAD